MKEQASNIGKKYGKENIIKYNKSPQHRLIAKKIGLKYGIHNLHAYASFIKENNCKIHKNCDTMYYDRINKEYIC